MWLNLQNWSKLNKNWNSIVSLTLKLHYCTILRHTKHMCIDGQICFHSWLSPTLSNSKGVATTWTVKSVGGINKEVRDAKLLQLPTTALACAVNCSYLCHLVKTQHFCQRPCGKYNPFPADYHPHHPPLPPDHLLYLPSIILQ